LFDFLKGAKFLFSGFCSQNKEINLLVRVGISGIVNKLKNNQRNKEKLKFWKENMKSRNFLMKLFSEQG